MRKDFLVDAYQVYEARVAGAGGVLIILRMLTRAELSALLDAASQLGLFALHGSDKVAHHRRSQRLATLHRHERADR